MNSNIRAIWCYQTFQVQVSLLQKLVGWDVVNIAGAVWSLTLQNVSSCMYLCHPVFRMYFLGHPIGLCGQTVSLEWDLDKCTCIMVTKNYYNWYQILLFHSYVADVLKMMLCIAVYPVLMSWTVWMFNHVLYVFLLTSVRRTSGKLNFVFFCQAVRQRILVK